MNQPTANHDKPVISVIVPVFNGESYLAEALQSILEQDYRPLQVLVVDDGSTDQSAALAETIPGVQVLRKEHSGLAATLNRGVAQATGALLAFLDADDLWLPGKLTYQVTALQNDPTLDMVFCHIQQFRVAPGNGQPERIFSSPQPGVAKIGMAIWHSSFAKVGGFSEGAERHDFLDWYARACGVGLKSSVLPEVLALRRVHEHNLGRQNPAVKHQKFLNALRANLNQRRQQGAGEHE